MAKLLDVLVNVLFFPVLFLGFVAGIAVVYAQIGFMCAIPFLGKLKNLHFNDE